MWESTAFKIKTGKGYLFWPEKKYLHEKFSKILHFLMKKQSNHKKVNEKILDLFLLPKPMKNWKTKLRETDLLHLEKKNRQRPKYSQVLLIVKWKQTEGEGV